MQVKLLFLAMVDYICPIFRFATQTFNSGYKSKINRYKMNLVLKILLIQVY